VTTAAIPTDTAPRRGADPVLIIAIVLAVLALAGAVFFGIRWASATSNESLTFSHDRDAALSAGEGGVVDFYTMDYRNPQKYFDLWAASSTGALNTQVQQYRKNTQFLSALTKAKNVTTAKVLEGAVTELDDHAGKASVIVAVDETVTPSGGKPSDKRMRVQGDLTRTTSGWQLSNIGVVPVEATNS
jgi:Mce-associated membrane protein